MIHYDMILKRDGYFSDHAMAEYCSKKLLNDFRNNITSNHKELLHNLLYSISILTYHKEPFGQNTCSLQDYLYYRYFNKKEPEFDFGAVYGITQMYSTIKELSKN